MFHRLLPIALIVLLCLQGCTEKSSEDPTDKKTVTPPDGALAKVGQQWVLQSDVDYLMQSGFAGNAAQAYDDLLQEAMLAEAALQEGLLDKPSVRAAHRRLLASRYLEQSLKTPDTPAETTIREAYDASADRFQVPAKIEIAALRRQVSSGNEAAARQALENAREAFRAANKDEPARDFGPIAARFSDEPNTRYQGGYFGWISEGQGHVVLPEPILDTAFALESSHQLLDTVIIDGSAWLVYVGSREPARIQPFERVRAQVKARLAAEAAQNARKALEQRVREAVPVTEIKAPASDNLKPASSSSPPALPQ